MKYLKSFNEAITDHFTEELQEFCEMNLAYLLDDGVEVQVMDTTKILVLLDVKSKVKIKFDEAKSWDEVKDYIIPFLTRLNNKYELSRQVENSKKDIRVHFSGVTGHIESITTTIEDIINDNLEISQPLTHSDIPRITDLIFYIKGYKQPKKSILTKIKSFFK